MTFVVTFGLPAILSPPDDVHRMAGGMFTISYTIAVIVPILCGALWDLTGIAVDVVHADRTVRRRLDDLRHYADPAKSTAIEEAGMAWLYLFVAGLFEMAWAIGLKYTEGFSRLVPSLLTVAAMIVSLALLGLALKTLPVGTAYAVWTGIGAVGTAALGIYLFGEPATAARLASMGLIVAGIVGLKLVTDRMAHAARLAAK